MYESLKQWMDIPLGIKPFIKRTGTGSKEFGELITVKCYPHADLKVVRNYNDEEVVSSTQLYIDGDTAIKKHDIVVFEEEEFTIQKIGTYYRNGKPDLKVVYI